AANTRADWPQWRGPNANGSSSTAGDLAVEWDQSQNVLWRTELPSWSAATPAVWGDYIFVTSAEEGFATLVQGSRRGAGSLDKDKILLFAIDRKDGSIRWQRQIDSGNQLYRKQNSASPSPITDGSYVWIMTGNGKFSCFTMDGAEVWQRDIQSEYGQFGLNHGYASTPLLYGDRLYVQVLHGMKTDDPSYVFAVEKSTGNTVWKVVRETDAVSESPDAYTTPQILTVDGTDQLVVTGGDYITGHDLDTGAEIWRTGGLNPGGNPFNRIVSSSIVIGNSVIASSTRGNPFIAFEVEASEGNFVTSRLWSNNLGSDVPTPASDGTYIYVVKDNGSVVCLKAMSGEAEYGPQRIELGTYSASPLLADGKLYCISEEGTTTVLEAGPAFKVLAVNRLDSHTLASPVADGSQLFIRTGNYLYCIQKK
ncbi:MAG: PQQ-like beta-propeller repeat protein, partial [Acidobacteriota bacterium]